MGPVCVLQVLLRSAFGMPLTDTPSGDSQSSGSHSEMCTRVRNFHITCAQTVYASASSSRSATDRRSGVTVSAVLFDTFHSVSTAFFLAPFRAACDLTCR